MTPEPRQEPRSGQMVAIGQSQVRPLGPDEAIYSNADVADALKRAANEARKREREGQKTAREAALAAQAEAHEAEMGRVNAETVARERAAHAHGFHKATWMMGVPALILGAVGGVLAVLGVQGVVWADASDATRENVLTGAMIERLRGDAGVADNEGER
jgi:hypothetical protein